MSDATRAMALCLTAFLLPVPLHAQQSAQTPPVAVAPRLIFTPAQMDLARAVAGDADLAAFYGANGLQPIFLGDAGAVRRDALRGAIADLPRHAIPAARYDLPGLDGPADTLAAEMAHARQWSRLLRDLSGGVLDPARLDPEIKRRPDRSRMQALMAQFQAAADPAAVLARAAPDHPAYLALQQALGAVPVALPGARARLPQGLWRPGMRDGGVARLRAALTAAGHAAPSADPALYDDALTRAVAGFQAGIGLLPDGVAGPRTIAALNGDAPPDTGARHRAIAVALERLRWMGGQDLDQRHVWVNIPEFSTAIVENGTQTFRTRSVMGQNTPEMRTPEFSQIMAHVVVNPSWNVPRSITGRDYLPRLQADRHALAHLDVVDGSGRTLARDSIDFGRWTAASFPYRLRQKPSDDNALGVVKFIFPNPWNIYLHDTPSKHLFANAVRADSNGCIRIGDPVDLAHALLSRQTDDPAAMVQRALDRGSETWLTLTPPVPVHLVYFTAWPGADGQIRLVDDIYGRDARIWDALDQAGRPAPDLLAGAMPGP